MARKPDVLEKTVRFVCGALLGCVLAMSTVLRLNGLSTWNVAGIAFVVVVGLGLLALKYGDRFWESILVRLLSWF